jgi:hypothetical protein
VIDDCLWRRRFFATTKRIRFAEIPCFASSPHDEFASSWFHRRLLRDSQQFSTARRSIAMAPLISLRPGGMCCISSMRHKNGRGGRFLTENIKGDGTPEGVQERADSTTAVSDFSFT